MNDRRHFDVLIVGAGLSGIDAAYRISTECPDRSWAILERRERMGGTWDLFRYPGVRSDSDMFTLGYQFRPWRRAKAIADGASIRSYIEDTAAEFGITDRIRYRQTVTEASWDSERALWTVDVNGGPADGGDRYTCSFLYMCSGYYSYDQGYAPEFPGAPRFKGAVVHPQHWPEALDYAGKRVVVIGSGATAVTLVPAMAERAAHVTMLQRSPSYIASLPGVDPLAALANRYLPSTLAHQINRWRSIVLTQLFYQFCRHLPGAARWALARLTAAQLPAGYALDPHFKPKYNPWDQRLCVVPDGDLFKAVSEGRASVVTDRIETFTETGIRLESGKELEADIIVTATGLQVLAGGGARIVVDGREIRPADTFVYRGLMLSGVPNFALCLGYTNASWTLRADLSSRYLCRLLNHMKRRGYSVAVPEHPEGEAPRPFLPLTSGYVLRAADVLPKQGEKPPWTIRQNYLLDYFTGIYSRLNVDMRFATAGSVPGTSEDRDETAGRELAASA